MSIRELTTQRQIAVQETNAKRRNVAKKMIWISFQKEGIHRYPAAETDLALATGDDYDVSFLAYPHRHTFHFKIEIQVYHNDRDIEFIQFKRWCESLYQDKTLDLNFKSCEMISDDLFEIIANKYSNREVIIDVSEDNENGSKITYYTT